MFEPRQNPYASPSHCGDTTSANTAGYRRAHLLRALSLSPLLWLFAFPTCYLIYHKLISTVRDPAGQTVLILGTAIGLIAAYLMAFVILLPVACLLRNRPYSLFPAVIILCVLVSVGVAILLQFMLNRSWITTTQTTLTVTALLGIPAMVCACGFFTLLKIQTTRSRKQDASKLR